MTEISPKTGTPAGVTRRTVVKGAAWAVPAIAVASAMPAMAVSGYVTVTPLSACKSPGNSCSVYYKGYALGFTVTNNTPVQIQIFADCVTNGKLGGVDTPLSVYATPSWYIAAGQSQTIYLGVSDQGSSPQTSISGIVQFTWWAPGEVPLDCTRAVAPFSAADTPPCGAVGATGQNQHCPPTATGTEAPNVNSCGANPAC